ncbi:MAG: phenylalanine--tRNA ligase subunit beta [Myxococcota bacterium]
MKVSWKWLEEWIDLSGLDVDDVVHRLTMAGLEVDGVDHLGEGHDDIVVARIDAIREHPDADKLVLCDVDDGSGELRQVACGAKNMDEGDLVPLALPGSKPPAVDFEIVAREVRGEMSSGMLCSGEELGLEDESDGLMILPETLEIGQPVFEALGLKDTVIELDLTPNRPDCLSHRGVARELGAIYGRDLKVAVDATESAAWEDDPTVELADEAASLEVLDEEGCPRYLFAVMEDVQVGPSPAWLKSRLAALGLRSVNNIVDVTNFILMDVGQPLHAFDLDELAGPAIRVRRAEQGEELVGIDHETYKLSADELVIADAERPVAVAGVMGGEETEVGDETTRILIECAYFDPTTVRKSSKRLGLHTDSSHRFERGVDPAALEFALQRAVRLIQRAQEHLSDTPASVRSGIAAAHVEGAATRETVELPEHICARILGVEIPNEDIEAHLESLGIELERTDDGWTATIPTYRPDLTRPIDLVEEVARLHGYDTVEPKLPDAPMGQRHSRRADATQDPTIVTRHERGRVEDIRTELRTYGLQEVINYGFMSDDDLDTLQLDEDDDRRDAVELANPLVASDRYMQTTLIPGLLENVQTNLAQRISDVAIFELGRRYFPDTERDTLAILLTGRFVQHWSDSRDWDFFDLKGLVEGLAKPFDTAGFTWSVPEPNEPYLHPGVQATWTSESGTLATIGRLHPEVASNLEIDAPVFVAEVHLDELLSLTEHDASYEKLSRYPAIKRDFAVVYDQDRPYRDLDAAVLELASSEGAFATLLESYELFDVYEGKQLPEGKRSLALSLVYRSDERTLTDEDVQEADQALITHLEDRVDAELR